MLLAREGGRGEGGGGGREGGGREGGSHSPARPPAHPLTQNVTLPVDVLTHILSVTSGSSPGRQTM